MIKVSIIIPMYNKGKFIKKCLESVFNQTYSDYEIIVVDDCSNDNGSEIVKSYSNVKLLHQNENSGPGSTRNKGAKEAKGKYITFLDADDEWLPTFLEETVKRIEENESYDCVVTSHYMDDENGNKVNMTDIFKKRGIYEGEWKISTNMNPRTFKPIINFFTTTGCVLMKKYVFVDLNGFYDVKRFDYGEDMYLWYGIAFKYKIYRIMKPLIYYHTNDSDLRFGVSNNIRIFPPVIDPYNLIEKCLDKYKNLLERCLAHAALTTVENYLSVNDIQNAEYVISLHKKRIIEFKEFKSLNEKIKNGK